MGWDGHYTPFMGMKQFVKENFNYVGPNATYRCIDYSVLNRTTLYAAVEQLTNDGQREVFAFVYLFRFSKAEWSYKPMDETSGPNESSCPERLLNLLTPTTSDFAQAWRQRCRENIARRNFEMKEGLILVRKSLKEQIVLKKRRTKFRWLCDHITDTRQYECQTTKKFLTLHRFIPITMAMEQAL